MWSVYKIVNLFYLLISNYIWFSFLLPGNVIPLIASTLMIGCFALGRFEVKFTPRAYALFGIIILYALYGVFILNFSYGALTLVSYLPAVLLFILDEERQADLLHFVTRWLCIIMGVSLFMFMVNYVVELPHFSFITPELSFSYKPFDNYLFFLKNNMYNTSFGSIFRFSGPFLEPGHQSILCSLLLVANRFQMKRYPMLWILLISIFASFSLAGYVILLIGFCLVKMRNVTALVGLGVVLAGGVFFVQEVWDNGNNPVKVLILDRLEFDGAKGIKGNNRTIVQTDYFFKQCVDDGTIWLGVRTQKEMKLKIRGAGFKIFMLKYGIIGTVFAAIIYLMLIPKYANRRYAASFFVLIVLIFLQRAYPSWYSWLFTYTLGIGIMRFRSFDGNLLKSQTQMIEEGDEPEYVDTNDEDAMETSTDYM